jgi:hypothetical protein
MSGPELGTWLRQQREARSWARPEMARQLIQAARSNGDLSLPRVGSVTQNIYRWERIGTVPVGIVVALELGGVRLGLLRG